MNQFFVMEWPKGYLNLPTQLKLSYHDLSLEKVAFFAKKFNNLLSLRSTSIHSISYNYVVLANMVALVFSKTDQHFNKHFDVLQILFGAILTYL